VYAALGDSITAGGEASTPANDYVSLVGAALGAQTTNLGIGGMTSGPVNLWIGTENIVYSGVLAAEVPGIPTNATLVTLYIGTNDYYLAGNQSTTSTGASVGLLPDYSNMAAVEASVESAYQTNIAGIIAGIKSRAPKARIVVATMPNYGWRDGHLGGPNDLAVSQSIANSFKATLVATGLTVVDLECEPGMYDEKNFNSPTDPHPNDAGHAIMAADFLAQIAHPSAPATSCQWMEP
jgi:lysophospholipase L1-like esterase